MGPGSHGSTYGGNPLVCAAALAVLQEIREQELSSHTLLMEVRIRETIRSWQSPVITEVRGSGLLLGVGLDAALIAPPEGKTAALVVVEKAMAKGLLIPPAGPETIRLLPPLNVTDAEIDEALEILRGVIAEF
jgi:acetylornithine/succinyldiaminopimelate/putrescine aminotransferase